MTIKKPFKILLFILFPLTSLVILFLLGKLKLTKKDTKKVDDKKEIFIPNTYPKNGTGYLNNNPFNIRHTNESWKRKITPAFGFERFENLTYGVRAGLINLKTLINIGNNTPWKLMHIYSPASDGNNPVVYANDVAKHLGVNVHDTITPSKDTLFKLAQEITRVENGVQLKDVDINEALQLI